jgi:hypothetical protein
MARNDRFGYSSMTPLIHRCRKKMQQSRIYFSSWDDMGYALRGLGKVEEQSSHDPKARK